MKNTLLMLGPALLLALALGGCNGKENAKPVSATALKTYKDPSPFAFSVQYPDGWRVATEPSKERSHAVFYSTQEIVDGFTRLEPKGNNGAKIEVVAQPGDQSGIDKSLQELKEALADDPQSIKPTTQTTVNGIPATMVRYSFALDDETFTAERYYFVTDSVFTSLEIAVIGNFDDYKAVFDSVRATFQPGRMPTPAAVDSAARVVRDSIVTDPPSATMKTYTGAFTMSYPENFSPTSLSNGVVFSGSRVDSKIQVNVNDTKGVSLDKIVEASKGNYRGGAPTKTTVGGQPAYVFNFSQGSTSARAYYVVSGTRLFVITAIWYTPQRDLYVPAYDRMIASFRPR